MRWGLGGVVTGEEQTGPVTYARTVLGAQVVAVMGWGLLVAGVLGVLVLPAVANLLGVLLGAFALAGVEPVRRMLTERAVLDSSTGGVRLRYRSLLLLPPRWEHDSVRLHGMVQARLVGRFLSKPGLELVDAEGGRVRLPTTVWEPSPVRRTLRTPIRAALTDERVRVSGGVAERFRLDRQGDAAVQDDGLKRELFGAVAFVALVAAPMVPVLSDGEAFEPVRAWLLDDGGGGEAAELAHVEAVCEPVVAAVAVSEAPRPSSVSLAPQALIPDGGSLPPVGERSLGEHGWEGTFDRGEVAASGPDSPERARRLVELGWQAGAGREWVARDGDQVVAILLQVDVHRFVDHRGALEWQAWVSRNGCRSFAAADRAAELPNGVRVRWRAQEGGVVEQVSFVVGPLRVRLATHQPMLPAHWVLDDVAAEVYRQLTTTLEVGNG